MEWRHVRVNNCVPFLDKLDLCQHKMKHVCCIHIRGEISGDKETVLFWIDQTIFRKKKEEKEGDETILFENRIFLFERERREKKHTWMFGKILFS